jgi:hypothetical protein
LASTGPPTGAVNLKGAAAGQARGRSAALVPATTASDDVLFDDNQCRLDLVNGPPGQGPALPGNLLLPSILILSLGDLGFQDNQSSCLIREGQMATAALLLGLWSARTVSNRFEETLGRAQFSAVTFALMNMTTQNQANHCLMVVGPLLQQALPNHVFISVFQKDYCVAAERSFTEALRNLAG